MQSLKEIKRNERQNQPDFNVGDIVILKDVNTPRQFWKLAKIEDFMESSDRVVRSVVICAAGKYGKRKLLRRAVQHLEIRSEPAREVNVYKEMTMIELLMKKVVEKKEDRRETQLLLAKYCERTIRRHDVVLCILFIFWVYM